jgi:hypothetical protein
VRSVQGCTAYDGGSNCIGCVNTSSFVSGVCIPTTTVGVVANCQVQNDFGCGECLQGYRLDSQGACQPGIVGCDYHSLTGACLKCRGPYYSLVNGGCAIVGCISSSNGVCQSCDGSLGFQLVNSVCEIENCVYFGQNGCITCVQGLVAGAGGCSKPALPVCLLCKSNEYMGSDGQCHTKDVHCISYKNGICANCC